MPETPPDVQNRITELYAAFNRRDVPAVLGALTPDVVWPNGWEGGSVKGRDQVQEYWTRQWNEIDPSVTPVGFSPEPDGRTAVDVHEVVRDHTGGIVADDRVVHVYRFDGPLVSEMEIRRR